ncbi:hypothetical protein QVM89_23645, partial [Serratia marcescens]|nr:hypothetical protein [Serratia marcescens]
LKTSIKTITNLSDSNCLEIQGASLKRVFGFLAERLFNVWILYNQSELKIKKMPIINIEGENVIKKGIGMLKRQFL